MKRAAFWLLLGCACLTACNRSTPPQTAQATPVQPAPAPDKVPDFESEPLTQAHLDLYLSVMQQAVGDRQHISDADKKVLADEADWYKNLKSGWHAPLTPAEQALMTRANELHNMDNDVARARGHYELYSAVREAIEGMVGPMKCGESDCGKGEPEDDPKLRAKQIEDDKKRKEIIKQDLVLLKPHESEITDLIKALRP